MLKELFRKSFYEFYELLFHSSAIGFAEYSTMAMAEKEWAIDFLNENPYYFLGLDFKQTRTFKNTKEYQEQIKIYPSLCTKGYDESTEISLFQSSNNDWYKIDWIWDEDTHGIPHCIGLISVKGDEIQIKIPDFIRKIKEYEDDDEQRIIWSTNDLIRVGSINNVIGVETTTAQLIKQIQRENFLLDDVKWQDLEDIVAEIYRNQGFKVIKTQRTRDGGRDLIVGGELIPGMDLKMAVEITTQNYVDKDKVSKAIVDNRNFPLIMIATTGRFSVGVKKLLNSQDYQLRLKLAGKSDILNWVNCY